MRSNPVRSLLRYGIAFLAAFLIVLAVVSVLSLFYGPPRPSYQTAEESMPADGMQEEAGAGEEPVLPESCDLLGRVFLTEEHPYRFTRAGGDEQIAVLNEIIAAIRGEGGEYYGPQPGGVEVAMEFDNGWLVGSRLGETGGEVLVVNRSGIFDVLLGSGDMPDMTVLDMHLIRAGYVVISAAQGPFSRAGLVFVLNDSEPDRFAVRQRYSLAGPPAGIWHVSGGDLLFQVDGQHFVLQSDGQFSRTSCSAPAGQPD